MGTCVLHPSVEHGFYYSDFFAEPTNYHWRFFGGLLHEILFKRVQECGKWGTTLFSA